MCDRFRAGVSRLVLVTLCVGVMVAPAWAQAGRLTGIVLSEYGNPMPGATVTAENPDANRSRAEAQTDDNGRFAMIGLASGRWTVTAETEGYHPGTMTAQVTQGAPRPVELRLRRVRSGLELTLGEAALEGLDPVQLEADLVAADGLFSAEQYSEALEAYQALLTALPDLTGLHLQIGHSYRELGQYDQAIAAYEALLKEDPDNHEAKASIGRANLLAGDFDAARETLGETASSLDASREDLFNMGELAFGKGDAEEAAGWYEKAHMKDPAWGKPLFKLGLVALNTGDMEAAVSFFEQVVDAEPDSEDAAQAKAVLQQLRP